MFSQHLSRLGFRFPENKQCFAEIKNVCDKLTDSQGLEVFLDHAFVVRQMNGPTVLFRFIPLVRVDVISKLMIKSTGSPTQPPRRSLHNS